MLAEVIMTANVRRNNTSMQVSTKRNALYEGADKNYIWRKIYNDRKQRQWSKRLVVVEKVTLVEHSNVVDKKSTLVDEESMLVDKKSTLVDGNWTVIDKEITLINKKSMLVDNQLNLNNKKIDFDRKKSTSTFLNNISKRSIYWKNGHEKGNITVIMW